MFFLSYWPVVYFDLFPCLVQISKGETEIPKWLSPGAQNILKRILDPNPIMRINMAGIKADDWFKQDYAPIVPNDDDDDKDVDSLYASLCIKEVTLNF